jgi:hypothetical protein
LLLFSNDSGIYNVIRRFFLITVFTDFFLPFLVNFCCLMLPFFMHNTLLFIISGSGRGFFSIVIKEYSFRGAQTLQGGPYWRALFSRGATNSGAGLAAAHKLIRVGPGGCINVSLMIGGTPVTIEEPKEQMHSVKQRTCRGI